MLTILSLTLQGLIVGAVLIAIQVPNFGSKLKIFSILAACVVIPNLGYYMYDTYTQQTLTASAYNTLLTKIPGFKGQAICNKDVLIIKGTYSIKREVEEGKALVFSPYIEATVYQMRECSQGWYPDVARTTNILEQRADLIFQIAMEKARIRQENIQEMGPAQEKGLQNLTAELLTLQKAVKPQP